jgi:hypothetical protein
MQYCPTHNTDCGNELTIAGTKQQQKLVEENKEMQKMNTQISCVQNEIT